MPDTPVRDTVYFYKFNNYYNRIIKRYDTIAEYTANATLLGSQANCNFVHGDGVNSEFYWNKGVNDTDTPDYVVVDDYKGNISRWFVTNSFKTRDRQDKLTLRRDLIADYYDDVMDSSPCLIRKGYVKQNSPFIFNDEGVQYNKQKEAEILIKDRSNCSYIIGFIANNAEGKTNILGTKSESNYDYNYGSLDEFPFKNYVDGLGQTHSQTKTRIFNNSPSTRIYYSLKYSGKATHLQGGSIPQNNVETIFKENEKSKPSYYTPIYSNVYNGNSYYDSGYSNNLKIIANSSIPNVTGNLEMLYFLSNFPNALYNSIRFQDLVSYAKQVLGVSSDYEDLAVFDGKKIKIGSIVYNATLKPISSSQNVINYNEYNPTIREAFYQMVNNINNNKPNLASISSSTYSLSYYSSIFREGDLKVLGETESVILELTPAEASIKTSVPDKNSRTHLEEQPYDMFMMINESGVHYKVGTTEYTSNHETNMNMAQAICQAYGTASYDIQIVPFNPMQGTILADGSINFYGFDVHPILNSNDQVVGHYVMCNSADLEIKELEKEELKFHPEDYKKDYNLKQYRLCSPNQETMFDFSPAMNNGIDTWNITANYRPFASYIRVQPTWGWLYGDPVYNNKTDFRGLLYNSTLCVTQLSDAWANYVSNNKNFQQLFDNQINTLTKQNEIQLNAMEETLGLRSFTGMPIGSILRVIGGSKDIEMTRELNNVALNKMETDFKYQMNNIQSMPHTIKKLTQINGNTRIFPFIEIYKATSDEERSFELKMKYTGMTVMTTGVISDFCKDNEETFIQASLIRLELYRTEETADNHIAVEIANELDKGIYITKEVE